MTMGNDDAVAQGAGELQNCKLASKNALVTGGSRGIGRAICLELASRGCNVAVNCTHGVEAAESVAAECRAMGVQAIVAVANVADHDAVKEMVAFVQKKLGSVDILVNNAGITRDNLMMRTSPEDFEAVLKVNLEGTFNCMKHASRIMLKQRSGAIVNMASVVGILGNAGQANYAASKAGVIGITKSAARELASRGVRVNAVAPGYIDTDMTRDVPQEAKAAFEQQILLGRIGRPEDVAHAVAFLALDDASYITGQVLCVDGGMAV